MKALALALCACTACAVDQSEEVTDPDRATLPSDAWFGGVTGSDTSVDDCIARIEPDDPVGIWRCSFELVLCHSGRAGMLRGDIVSDGVYSMDASIATISVGDPYTEYLTVDLATGETVPGGNFTGMRWLPDIDHRWAHLEQFGFDCTPVPN